MLLVAPLFLVALGVVELALDLGARRSVFGLGMLRGHRSSPDGDERDHEHRDRDDREDDDGEHDATLDHRRADDLVDQRVADRRRDGFGTRIGIELPHCVSNV